MKTQPTINSIVFKQIECPTCKQYPSRWQSRKEKGWSSPKLNFIGIRWVAEKNMIEIQGYCEHCFKEHRIQIEGIDGTSIDMITLFNPKESKSIGPIGNFVKRWNA